MNYRLIRKNAKTNAITYDVNVTVDWNVSASGFTSMLNNFDIFYGYYPSTVLTRYDATGTLITNAATPSVTNVYTVTINSYRSPTLTGQSFIIDASKLTGTVTPTVAASSVQAHSPPISGTYRLSLNNTLVSFWNSTTSSIQSDIPFDTPDWALQSWMSQSWDCKSIEVQKATGGSYVDGLSFIVSWAGCKGNKDLILTNSSALAGGRAGAAASITATEIRAGSTNLLFEPINNELTFTPAAKSQVIVKVGGVASQCRGDCSYEIRTATIPKLAFAALNLANGQVTLNVTNPGALTYNTPNDFTITIDGQPCKAVTGTNSESLTCTLPVSNGKPVIRAGAHTPFVEIANVGIVPTVAGFTPIQVTLTATATNPAVANVGLSGGANIGIVGHGYPLSLSDTPFTVNICGTNALVVSVSNTNIGVRAPACLAASLPANATVSYKGQTATVPFDYNSSIVSPTITQIAPTSASPVLKGFLEINGTGFGTDLSLLSAYLVNSTGSRVYALNVITATAGTYLKVRLPGGESGVFTVVVNKLGAGDSVEATTGIATFTYEIVVTSITPTTGSPNGGTLLTITGRNFSPDPASNQVAIGDAINNWCLVKTSTATTITCVTPPLNIQYTNLTQNVIVVGRAMIDSTCGGNCLFNYENTTFPTVTAPASLNFTAGVAYTINGTGLIVGGVNPKVYVGDVEATVNVATPTSVTFVYPVLVTGTYPVNVYVSGFGYATPTLNSFTPINAVGISNTTGSKIGNIITINGNGFVPSTDPNFNVTVTKTGVAFPYTLVSSSPTAITIRLGSGSDSNAFAITTTYKTASASFNYTIYNTSTPKVSLVGSTNITYTSGLFLTFNRTTLISETPTVFTAIPLNPAGTRFAADIPLNISSVSATNSTFTVDASPLGAGKYSFSIYYPKYGYADISATLEIQASAYTVASVVSSYQGGKLITVAGTGLSKSSTLDVGGAPAKFVSGNANALVYEIPPFVTQLTQSTYSLVQAGPLSGKPIADTAASAPLAFDTLQSTVYSSSAATCFVGVDFGDYLRVNISRVRFFPYRGWRSAGSYLLGANITASVDGTTWTNLYTIDSTVHTGWNIWRPNPVLATAYRYVRFEHNSTSKCQLAEFEVSGVLYAGVATNTTTNLVDVHFSDGFHPVTWAGKVEYRDDATPTVTLLSPTSGTPTGGTTLTITGTGFGSDPSLVSVLVDGVACVAQTAAPTQITCLTGARTALPTANTFDVSVNQNRASVTTANFTYANRWSDPLTWGGDIPPIAGDTVYVPKGMVLLVDQSTPNLKTIVVEGAIIFADEDDYVIETGSIIVNFGVFRAGTEKKPYSHQLTFLLHGGYYDKQLPGMGNKGIGCHCCKFDMYGTPRVNTWSDLATTANVGDTNITVRDSIDDWKVGDIIAIASTSFVHE